MAKSRLHELSEHGQSVWIDSLSRQWLRDGTMRKLIDEDAVVGVTSNPTIFQKALSQGDWYDEQLRELIQAEEDPKEIFWQLAVADITEACDLFRPIWDGGKGQDGYVSLEVDPDIAYEQRRDDRAGAEAARVGRQAEPVREDPGDRARARRDRGVHRARQVDQRHADLLARALRGGRAGVHPRARAARRGRRRSVARRVGRVVLRLSRRHRGGQAPRCSRQAGAEGEARDREREARVPALPGAVLGRALGARSRPRARRSSAASGPRPRRRTPSTAT